MEDSLDHPEESQVDLSAGERGAFESFDPQTIKASRVSGSIFSAVLTSGLPIAAIALYFSLGWTWWFGWAIALATIILLLLWAYAICWPAIEYKHRSWRLTEAGLELRSGVWFKSEHAVPWARVQHADVSQGPIQRWFGVGTLTVHTAGTSDSSIEMEGFNHAHAIELRDQIIRQRKSGDVV